MRVFKWLVALLLLLAASAGLTVSALIVGVFSLDLSIEDESIWAQLIRYQSGLDIHFSKPAMLTLGRVYTLHAPDVTIDGPKDQERPLVHITNLDANGRIDFGILQGETPVTDLIVIDILDIVLTRNTSGNLVSPEATNIANIRDALSSISPQGDPSAPFRFLEWVSPAVAQSSGQNSKLDLLNVLPLRRATVNRGSLTIIEPERVIDIVLGKLDYAIPTEAGEGSLTVEGTLNKTPFSVDFDVTAQGKIAGNLELAKITASLQGEIAPRMDMELQFAVENTAVINSLIGAPLLPSGPFSGDLNVDFERGRILRVNIRQLLASNSAIAGTMSWSIMGRALNMDLNGNRLTLEDFLPAGETTSLPTNQAPTDDPADQRFIPDLAVPAVILRERYLPEFSDANISLKFARISGFGLLLDHVFFSITAADTHVDLFIQEMGIGLGGKVTGTMSAQAGGQGKLSANLEIFQLPISTFYKYQPALSNLDGKISGEIHAQSQGTTLRELLAQLSGTAKIGLEKGSLLLPERAVQTLQTISPSILKGNLLLIDCNETFATFNNGVSEDLHTAAKARNLTAYGNGRLDLREETLSFDSLSTLSVLGSYLAIPVAVSGNWTTLQPEADLSGLISGHAKVKAQPVDVNASGCHAVVAESLPSEYDTLPPAFRLDEAGRLLGLKDKLETRVKTLQEKISEKISEKQEGGSGHNTDDPLDAIRGIVQESLQDKAEQSIEDTLQQEGADLLKGLLGH